MSSDKVDERTRRILFWCILLTGAALRFVLLGRVPAGLNQDEASAGYEAWSLLHDGIDRNGSAFPVLFKAWGSGQNVLYSYLSMPFIALFGLNAASLRLTAAVYGTLSLPLLYSAVRETGDERAALWSMAALAIDPWHILLSRWALESNLLPFCLLLGIWALTKLSRDGRFLLAASAAFALALYAYGTAFFFLALFLPPAAVYILVKKRVTYRTFFLSLGIFLLLALPITLCQLRNALSLGELRLLGMTLPRLNEARQSSVSILGGGGGLSAMRENLRAFFRLLLTQNDGLIWNYAGRFGLLYGKPGLLLALAGAVCAIVNMVRKRALDANAWCLLWFAASLAAACFISVNVNRVNMAFLPLVWLQGLALAALARPFRAAAPSLALILLALGTAFSRYYFTDYAEAIAPCFYDGLGEAIEYACADEDDTVWVSFDVNMPYIFVLFYEQLPPQAYLDTVQYMNPGGAFEWVTAFDRYRFGYDVPPEDGTVCILRADKLRGIEPEARYGEWCVVRMRVASYGP